ncbi:telomeric repeat-binding factor 2-interacting protein 1 isoform 1-T2 [Odontesthes bonariensis]|uniref:telomeric repeat-binding factor 2-interacting protein 1 n=1 Tax=Odontesthes bonariensis TaxID=219752 RepID=UPI003F58E651
MPSKRQDVSQSVSPVLFMTVDGEPMSFFLRPGPVKRKLQPLITAGGGLLCNVQQPGAILLIDPKERNSVLGSSVHWYVSTQYIHDCIEKEEQLNIEDYRLNPEVAQRHSPRPNSSRDGSSALSGGRIPYTPEDDAAILEYVRKRKTETGGNRLWQEMEKGRVTGHSWQSMKYRYKERLANRGSGAVEVETAEDDSKAAEETSEVEANQQLDARKPSSEGSDAHPHTHAAESDLTQIDIQFIPAENVDTHTSIPLKEKEQPVNQQTAEENESTQPETEKAPSPQTEACCADLQTDTQPSTADTSEPDRDGPQTAAQKRSLPEDSPSAQLESSPKDTSSKKQKEKQKASDSLEQPMRRITRRQLELEALSSPEPYGKKLRSSSSSGTSSPQSLKKNKSAVKFSLQKDTTTNQPPRKRAREKIAAAEAESQPEQSGQDAASKTDESNSAQQKAVKKKEKRQLGILELATKEFEDESESDEDEAPDLQNNAETVVTPSGPTPPDPDTAADPTSTQSKPETGPSPQENVQKSQAWRDNCVPDTGSPDPAAAEPAVSEPVGATSKAHLFIFDNDSQEEDSQSVIGECSAAPSNQQPKVNKDAALSLTQLQLEEDKQRVRELMNQTGQDLVSVTKALLKTSGDFSAALDLLLNPSTVSLTFWNCRDDSLLKSADPVGRQQLQEKYGEENVAKRIVFLEVEG